MRTLIGALALALAPTVAADWLDGCGLTESDQFVGVLLFVPNWKSPPAVYVHGLSHTAEFAMWITNPGYGGAYDAFGGGDGYTALEAAFSSLVRLPPEEFKRWPMEPHCEFTAHTKNGSEDSAGHVFQAGARRSGNRQIRIGPMGFPDQRPDDVPAFGAVP